MPSTTMPSTTRRITTTAVSIALALTACSGDNNDTASTVAIPTTTATTTTLAPSTTTSQTTTTTTATTTISTQPNTTTSTTTAATSTTTTSTATTVPTTQPGEPDWAAIVQGLLTTLHELRAAPDIDRIGELCLAGENLCQSRQGEEIRGYVDEGWRVEGMPLPIVVGAARAGTADDAPVDDALWVLARTRLERPDLTNARVVDSSGATVFDIVQDPDDPNDVLDIYLVRAGDDWRVLAIDEPPTP